MRTKGIALLHIFLASLLLISVYSCNPRKDSPDQGEMDGFINDLMSRMTLEEKIGQLNLPASGDVMTGLVANTRIAEKIRDGNVGGLLNVRSVTKIRGLQQVAVEDSRLGIPLIFGLDVIHGYRTTFPIPLGLASSFDMDLIERMARISAVEASADGICWTFSPMVDLTRDPRWGRIAEGAGEDPYLGARVAKAYVHGYQGDDLTSNNTILGCVKHFALYGASEAGRDYNTTDMSRIRMYNEYMPPYKAAVDAGVGSAMTAFNEVDGIPSTGNRWLMTELLREEWGFDGFVVTDHQAIKEMIQHGMGDEQTVSALALNAGTDMDMVGESYLNTLKKSLQEGRVTENQIDQACRRILEAKFKLGLFDDPYRYCDTTRANTLISNDEHHKAARSIASQTFVLLKNDNQLLPLEKKGKIALVGPLAHSRYNMAGMWSVAVDHEESVTVLEGFREVVGSQAAIHYAKGCNIVDDPEMDRRTSTWRRPSIDTTRTPDELLNEAVAVAASCDVVVAVVGEAAQMSGESSSRSDITLPGNQQQLLEALLETGKPVVMVLFTGRPLDLRWEQENMPAILNVWFGGTQGGPAIADVIFNEVNPSGKLPSSFPQNIGQVPLHYNHKNTGRPLPEGAWFKKFLTNYLDVSNDPLYPFGFGLSYTRFDYGELSMNKTQLTGNDTLLVQIDITNSGEYDGAEVVQLYIRDLVGSVTRPVKELKGFQKIFLKAGETRRVTFSITPEDLKFYNYDLEYVWEPGEFIIMVGGNSRDVKPVQITWSK